MPTYEYRCPTCKKDFEKVQKMSEPPRADCPSCGAPAERRLSAGAGLLFKGSGFYITDYRSESYKKAAGSESAGEKGGGEKSGGEKGGGEKGTSADSSGKSGGDKGGSASSSGKGGGDKGGSASSSASAPESKPSSPKKDD